MVSDNMDNKILKDLIIFGIIIIIVAIGFSFLFSPSSDAHNTNLQILNKGDLGPNSTIYVKLTDNEKTSLGNKTVHIKLIDKKNKVIFKKDVTTHSTGVGMAKLSNISAGEYTLNVSYDGDSKYTHCSISKKVTVNKTVVKDTIDNSNLTENDLQDISNTQLEEQEQDQTVQYNQDDYTPATPSSDDSSSSSDDNDESNSYYDENGNEIEIIIDENGNEVNPTDTN